MGSYSPLGYPDAEFAYWYAANGTHTKVSHGHTYYEFFLTLNDSTMHHINGEEQVLRADMLVFIRPKDNHYFSTLGKTKPRHIALAVRTDVVDTLFSYLGKEGPLLQAQLMEPDMPPVCVLTERESRRVADGLNKFNVFGTEEKEELSTALRFFLSEIVAMFVRKRAPESEGKEEVPKWLEAVCEQMSRYENFVEGLPRMVQLSGKTREHLSRSMQKYKNITVSAYINNLRLEYAANMLVNSNLNVLDVCYESGFSSLDYFGKQFKNKYGTPPSQFRILMKMGQQ